MLGTGEDPQGWSSQSCSVRP